MKHRSRWPVTLGLLTSALRIGAAATVIPIMGCTSMRPDRPALWTYDHGGIIRGDLGVKALALVFTGGEHGEGTPHILDELRRRGVKASFFLTGQYLAKDEHLAFVRRMVAEGHYVGPHSHGHLLYCDWEDRERTLVGEEEFKADLRENIAALQRLGALRDGAPVYFIPPYEYYNADQVRWAADLNVVLFNFTPGSGSHRDWIPEGHRGFAPSEAIIQDILNCETGSLHGLRGFLLLLHLASLRQDKLHPHLDTLLDGLSARGYQFVRVDELLRGARVE